MNEDVTHTLRSIRIEHRAGELMGYYALCACGFIGKLRSTSAAAALDHRLHATGKGEK